jgi:hypothetical protein
LSFDRHCFALVTKGSAVAFVTLEMRPFKLARVD